MEINDEKKGTPSNTIYFLYVAEKATESEKYSRIFAYQVKMCDSITIEFMSGIAPRP